MKVYKMCFDHTGDVERQMHREQEAAALRIQTRWRGYRVRAGLHQRKSRVMRIRAAVRIQRMVRCNFLWC